MLSEARKIHNPSLKMESASAPPIPSATRPNTPTTSEYGSQAASGEATPTNNPPVSSFADFVKSALAKVKASSAGEEEYDPACPTPMDESPAETETPRYNLRNHRSQPPIPSDSEGSAREAGDQSKEERIEELARAAFNKKHQSQNPYKWRNPLFKAKQQSQGKKDARGFRKRIKNMTSKPQFQEKLIFGKAGPPPKFVPIKEDDLTNEKGNVVNANLKTAILHLQGEVIKMDTWQNQMVQGTKLTANRAETLALESLRRHQHGCIELRGKGLEAEAAKIWSKARLFCHCINKKFGVDIAEHDLADVYWSGPVLCGHFHDLKAGGVFDTLVNRKKRLGSWAGLESEKDFHLSIDRTKTNQERLMVTALTWLKIRHQEMLAAGKMKADEVKVVKVKTLPNGIAIKAKDEPDAPLFFVRTMSECEALFTAEELELFNDSKKRKRDEYRSRAKDRKKAEKRDNPNFMPLGPSPKPKEATPAEAAGTATAAATQAERIGQLDINADTA